MAIWNFGRNAEEKKVGPKPPPAPLRPKTAIPHGTPPSPKERASSASAQIASPIPFSSKTDLTTGKEIRKIVNEEDLPPYEWVFGTDGEKVVVKDSYKSGIVGLVHADKTVTMLLVREYDYLRPHFEKMLLENGLTPGELCHSFPDYVFSFYKRGADALGERKKRNVDLNTPAETDKVLNKILEKALQYGASDIDIHVLTDAIPPVSKVFFRIHGALIQQKDSLVDPDTALSVCRAAYTGTNADSASRSATGFKTNQGLYATLSIPAVKNLRLRMQTMPHVLGFGMNLRILSYDGLSSRYSDLVAMGFEKDQQELIIDSFATERGGLILFIAGTGEGKTTTLMTGIPLERNFDNRKWLSIEDPVEIINPRLFQSPVKRETGNSHDDSEHRAAMTNSLRFDPDGINAGEIRDAITAQMSEKAAMTGHITCATLHGNDVFSAFNRLIDLGARKVNLLDGVVRLFCHQKLVQTVCQSCSILAVNATELKQIQFLEDLVETYDVDTSKVRFRGVGCQYCYAKGHPLAGVNGRTVVAEVVRFNRLILDSLRDHETTNEARIVWRQQRNSAYHESGTLGKTLSEHALYKLLTGKIDPIAYVGVADEFDTHNPLPMIPKVEKVRRNK